MQNFTHFHLHSHYSLLEGAIQLDKLPFALKEKNMTACALTDHGNLFGAIEFYKKMNQKGLKPIVGQGFFLQSENKFPSPTEKHTSHSLGKDFALNLICLNLEGYKNLIKISSHSFANQNANKQPTLLANLLQQNSAGLVALLPGIESELGQLILQKKFSPAKELLGFYQKVFGKNCYLEIFSHLPKAKTKENELLFDFATQNNLPILATNNCFYLDSSMGYAQHILKQIGKKKTIHSSEAEPFLGSENWLKSYEEMLQTFQGFPETLLFETTLLAERCDLDLSFQRYYLPTINPPKDLTLEQFFKTQTQQGLELKLKRLKKSYLWSEEQQTEKTKIYQDRVQFEMDVIESMGYVGYFLIVADFIAWAKNNGVTVGPGRGSGAGSLVAYALDITDIDPMEYDLLFERFLNPERTSMPDFDIDFDTEGRERVIDYVRNKYGKNHVCQISTIGTLQAKGSIHGVGRVLGFTRKESDGLASLVPKQLGVTLKNALESSEELRSIYENQDDERSTLLKIALEIEGMASSLSTHAAGVVIMSEEITNILPLCFNSDGSQWQTQYSMEDIESQGAVKFDFLGLTNLSILKEAVHLVEKQGKVNPPDLTALPLNDPKVFTLLERGLSVGIFQLESYGMKKFIRQFRPKNFEELIALIAVYRPGPLQAGMDKKFVQRKDGMERYVSLHPKLDEILKSTYGVITYQEQIMRIAQSLAGYTLGQADILRRAIGKKKNQELNAQEEKFVQGMLNSGFTLAQAQELFGQIKEFGNYGFNKSHAAAYGLISYQTAYLKVHFRLEFITALLNYSYTDEKKIAQIILECKEREIVILPPSINKSQTFFAIEEGKIRFGLLAVKNVGGKLVEHINLLRQKNGPFQSLEDFYQRIDANLFNINALKSMIKAGVLDQLEPNRKKHWQNCDEIFTQFSRLKTKQKEQQKTIFDAGAKDSEWKLHLKEDGKATPFPFLENFQWEQELLGYSFSQGNAKIFSSDMENFRQNSQLSSLKILLEENEKKTLENKKKFEAFFFVVARIINHRITQKENQKYFGRLLLEDEKNSAEITAFHNFIAQKKQWIEEGEYQLFKIRSSFHSEWGAGLDVVNVYPLHLLRKDFATKVFLHFSKPPDFSLLNLLKNLFEQNPGKTRVIFRFAVLPDPFEKIEEKAKEEKNKVVELQTNFQILCTPDFYLTLCQWIPLESTQFHYPPNFFSALEQEESPKPKQKNPALKN